MARHGRKYREAAALIERMVENGMEVKRKDLELMVYGHSHVATLTRISATQAYANPGSWLDRPTFLRITDTQVALREWDGSAESPDLDTLDRTAEKPLP